jgi:hypothetical protein
MRSRPSCVIRTTGPPVLLLASAVPAGISVSALDWGVGKQFSINRGGHRTSARSQLACPVISAANHQLRSHSRRNRNFANSVFCWTQNLNVAAGQRSLEQRLDVGILWRTFECKSNFRKWGQRNRRAVRRNNVDTNNPIVALGK